MKNKKVFAAIAATVITASIATTACLTASALNKQNTANKNDVYDSGVTAP